MISKGESDKIEFKSSFRYDVENGKADKNLEFECIKTIAAFLNSEGGTLFIGVEDKKGIIGLETSDFLTFSRPDKIDEWRKNFDNKLENSFNNSIHALINLQFVVIDNKTIAIVTISSSPNEIWITNNKGVEELYIRRMASSKALQGQEITQYIKLHWK